MIRKTDVTVRLPGARIAPMTITCTYNHIRLVKIGANIDKIV